MFILIMSTNLTAAGPVTSNYSPLLFSISSTLVNILGKIPRFNKNIAESKHFIIISMKMSLFQY